MSQLITLVLQIVPNDNRRGPIYGQFMAGDVLDALPIITPRDWKNARIAQRVADNFILNMTGKNKKVRNAKQ